MVDLDVPHDHKEDSLLLRTKLYRPPLTPELEERHHLVDRLERYRQRPLTLISAPPGYGKTMLASMWLETSSSSSAWFSVDEEDDEPATFIRYVLAAIANLFPEKHLNTRALLEMPTLAPPTIVARLLLNDLGAIDKRFILVLDDLHLVRAQWIYDFLAELLRHPSPALHLVLISRIDPPLPIASLRARGKLTEVRLADLRFAATETANLLETILERPIDAAVAAEWTELTEGWVTALRLAALSLRHRGRTSDLRRLSSGGGLYLQEYLLAEVLAYQSPVEQRWLLQTSLLDRFCAPLCEAVSRVDEDRLDGKKFIQWLEENSLFLIRLDARGEWFRFHHLFRQLLRGLLDRQLSEEARAVLYQRAGHWFAERGLNDEAIPALVRGDDVEAAVAVVVGHRHQLMNTQQWQRLQTWLGMLPEDVVRQHPLLMSSRSHSALYSGQLAEWMATQQALEQMLVENRHPYPETHQILAGELAVLNAARAVFEGEASHAVAESELALAALPADALYMHGLALVSKAIGHQMSGEPERAVSVITEALHERRWPPEVAARLNFYLAVVCYMDGDLSSTQHYSQTCLRISEAHKLPETLSFARNFVGVTHFLRNELDEAEQYLVPLLADRATSAAGYVATGAYALAVIYLERGERSKAEEVLNVASAHFREAGETTALAIMVTCRVDLAVRLGQYAKAQRLSSGVNFDLSPPLWGWYVPQLTRIQILLTQNTPASLAEANATLEALDAYLIRNNRNVIRIDVLALQALLADAEDRADEATEKLREATTLAARGGFVRNFIGLGLPMFRLLRRLQKDDTDGDQATIVAQILDAFSQQAPTAAHAADSRPDVALTKRELQTLRLLATELSPEEIAAEMDIAASTTRTYIKQIYRKLGVQSRYEAVHAAKAFDLV